MNGIAIFIYLQTVLSIYLVNWFTGLIVPCRLPAWKMILWSSFLSLGVIPKICFGAFSPLALFSNLIIFVLWVGSLFIFYEGKIWKRIAVWLYFIILQMFCDGVTMTPSEGWNGRYDEYAAVEFILIIAIKMSVWIALSAASLFLLRTIFMRRFQRFYLLFFLYPASIMVILYCAFFSLSGWVWMCGILLGVISEIGMLSYTISQEKKVRLEEELRAVQHTMELERIHYQMMEERREALARIRHDFNNHLSTIGRLVSSGQKSEADALIRRLAEEIAGTKETPYCDIPVVNAVLSEKGAECIRQGIRLEAELYLPSDLEVEPLELCSVFSNLMDNAIHGCVKSKSQQPVIRLASRVDGDYLFLKCENPSLPPEDTQEPGHGYGTKILSRIAQAHGGDYTGSYEDGIYRAVVCLAHGKDVPIGLLNSILREAGLK